MEINPLLRPQCSSFSHPSPITKNGDWFESCSSSPVTPQCLQGLSLDQSDAILWRAERCFDVDGAAQHWHDLWCQIATPFPPWPMGCSLASRFRGLCAGLLWISLQQLTNAVAQGTTLHIFCSVRTLSFCPSDFVSGSCFSGDWRLLSASTSSAPRSRWLTSASSVTSCSRKFTSSRKRPRCGWRDICRPVSHLNDRWHCRLTTASTPASSGLRSWPAAPVATPRWWVPTCWSNLRAFPRWSITPVSFATHLRRWLRTH